MREAVASIVMAAVCINVARADFHEWAPTPPMGWNSWDCYGSMVDEAAYKANADWQAARLLKFGYDYCVVDIRWTVANETSSDYNQKDPDYTLDAFGRYLPAPNRFPSAADGKGFKPLADYVHAKGLKFGIHIMRGVPKEAVARKLPVKGCPGVTCDMITDGRIECSWLGDNCTVVRGRKGAQAYYDSILELYASWGVDFIKCDDLSYPYHADEIEMLRAAIDACGRKIVLSTSPGETPLAKSDHVAKHANMWRMVGDLWDSWRAVNHLTDVAAKWVGKPSVPGSWADCDMIPLGRLCVRAYRGARNARLSKDEARYLMTLMCIVRSPLMIGSDLPSLEKDPETLALLTDAELLAVHRTGGKVCCDHCTPEECVIVSETPDGRLHVALFNRSNSRRTVRGVGVEADLAPHAAALRVVPPATAEVALPEGYQALEYVESTGEQYVDTGYRVKAGDAITAVISARCQQLGKEAGAFGAQPAEAPWDNACVFDVRMGGAGVYRLWRNHESKVSGRQPGFYGQKIEVAINPREFKWRPFGAAAWAETCACAARGDVAATLYVFAIHAAAGDHVNPIRFGRLKLYSLSISSADGKVQRDFVPCRRRADGEIGLYDRAGGRFYASCGSEPLLASGAARPGVFAGAAKSPDGRNEIRLWANPLAYEVRRDGVTLVAKTEVGLTLDGRRLGPTETVRNMRTQTRAGVVKTPIYKKCAIDLAANETEVDFGDWSVRLGGFKGQRSLT